MKGLLRLVSFACPLLPAVILLTGGSNQITVNHAVVFIIPASITGAVLYFFSQDKEDRRSGLNIIELLIIYALLSVVITPVVYFAGCLCAVSELSKINRH